MLGLGTALRTLRAVARLYRFWRLGIAATGALAAAPVLPFLAPSALWLVLAFIALAVRLACVSRGIELRRHALACA